ncbi:hypothetical protein Q3A68_08490 [Mucilaginibacter sp. BT774]|nr:hypothetical protein [Mucilaginibacter sp. BT774]
MEIVFVLTHAVMIICLIGIISVSISGTNDHAGIEKSHFISALVMRFKTMQINTGHIARTATALLSLFLR